MITSVFPSFLDYSFLAITFLRITLGLIFIWFAYTKIMRERTMRVAFFEKLGLRPPHAFFWTISGVEGVVGILLVLGAYTQIAALVTGVLMTIATFIKWRKPSALPYNTIEFYILLAVVSFTLVSFGAGAFAFDLPL